MTEKEVREELKVAIGRGGLTQTQVAKEIGISGASLSQWLNERYQGSDGGLASKAETWLRNHRQRLDAAMPTAPAWIETATGIRILTTLKYAQHAGDIAVIYGGAGVGKTSSVRYYAEQAPNVWIASMSPATSSSATALEEVCDAVGLRDASGGAARLQRALVKRLRDSAGLLIVDESQHLSVNALESLRCLHDATGVGLAFVGNETVYARLAGGMRAATFAQLFSRIGKRLRLGRPVSADVEAVATAWGIEGVTERVLLATIAETPGALRAATKTLRLASLLARADNGIIEARHLKNAWRDLGGESLKQTREDS